MNRTRPTYADKVSTAMATLRQEMGVKTFGQVALLVHTPGAAAWYEADDDASVMELIAGDGELLAIVYTAEPGAFELHPTRFNILD